MAITMFPSHRQICEIVELKKAFQILIQCFCLFFLLFITPLFIFFFLNFVWVIYIHKVQTLVFI